MADYRELFVNHFRDREPRAEDLKRIKALSDAWVEVVCDAVKFARAEPGVDGERVALVGFSLGGCLALAAAARPELKLAAVVEFFGTLPRELRPGLGRLPPALIFHGEQDEVVPVDEAYALIGLLATRKLEHEAHVYRDADHMFATPGGQGIRQGDYLSAKLATDAFLKKHLRPREAAAAAR